MTAHRARSHARHARPSARAVPAHLAHLHPDWLPPGGYSADGRYNDSAGDDRDQPTAHTPADPVGAFSERPPAPAAPIPFHTGSPRACNSQACPTTPDAPIDATACFHITPPRAEDGPVKRPPHPDDEPEDEDAIFRDPYQPAGRETQLLSTALPLRHRIYALHCQGRSLSAIARRLRLDRGTVARHLHATEDLLLAEQAEDLARLRLRAIEAQHAILAACWDALVCEELTEHDRENEQPYKPRRAQLLATAARAARTAAQLQGLLTPAALQAALQSVGAPGDAPVARPTTPPIAADDPSNSIAGCAPSTPPADDANRAASCGIPASSSGSPSPTHRGEDWEMGSAVIHITVDKSPRGGG